MIKSEKIPILLTSGETIEMLIYEEQPNTLMVVNLEEAYENGESPYQLKEGCFYEYLLPDGFIPEESPIIKKSQIEPFRGRIHTNNYVGTFKLNIYKEGQSEKPIGDIALEIQSIKTSYRKDYRIMLEDITEICVDLLLRHSSPVSQTFTTNVNSTPQTLYQRFAFVKSLIQSESFVDAMHRINSMPVKRWKTIESVKSICNIKRANRSVMRQIMTNANRISLPVGYLLKDKFDTLPNYVHINDKRETADIPENRFIKYVLETFLQFTLTIANHPEGGERLQKEALATSELLEKYIILPVFKEVSKLDIIPLNSPVLQRKEGYREVLQAYLMFDMASCLVWRGGENVYSGGKRDVAILYEYWLFFQMLKLIEDIFQIKSLSIDHLIEPVTDNTLELTLKQGCLKIVDGEFEIHHRKFQLMFSYNRTFERAVSYPLAGSWTRSMRPDYTLSIWPSNLTQQQAEMQEMIVHLHFDAKYKIENFKALLKDEDEKIAEEGKEYYKRVDFLKMHAYKDAIRRTAGAYILYPGSESDIYSSYHEVLPGVGAFSVSPANTHMLGLKEFLQDVVRHLSNRTSQRSLFSYHTFRTFEHEPGPEINDKLPLVEYMEFPAITYVLVGYYKNQSHLDWILQNLLYNVRTDYGSSSLKLSPKTIGAKYLLLYTKDSSITNKIFRLALDGPCVVSKEFMEKKLYPSKLTKPYYIGYSLQSSESISNEFGYIRWDIQNLSQYRIGRNSFEPFSVTLEELMKGKCQV